MVHRTQEGMTLIEVMVALALLSFLALGILTAFRSGARTYTQVVRGTTQSRDVLLAQRTLRALIDAAEVPDPSAATGDEARGLHGTADTLVVNAPVPMATNGGTQRYRIALRARHDGTQDLVVDVEPSEMQAANDRPARAGSDEEVLVPRVQSLRWMYRAAGERDGQGVEHDSAWQTTWPAQRHAPALVALEIEFPVGDGRHWPVFYANPRVTDSARCEFDVVAQACRGSGT